MVESRGQFRQRKWAEDVKNAKSFVNETKKYVSGQKKWANGQFRQRKWAEKSVKFSSTKLKNGLKRAKKGLKTPFSG